MNVATFGLVDDINSVYKVKAATQKEIEWHLMECNNDFIPPLEHRTNIKEYAQKLYDKTVTFELWINQKLIGLLAAYLNDQETFTGYISNVSLLRHFQGKGRAGRLLDMCIKYAMANNFKTIFLEVSQNKERAIHLYEKFGFRTFENRNDMFLMKLEIKDVLQIET